MVSSAPSAFRIAAVLSPILLIACGLDDTTAPLSGPSSVHFVHALDGTEIGHTQELPVDIALDEQCILTDVQFGTITAEMEIDPGVYFVTVHPVDPEGPCEADPIAAADMVQFTAHSSAAVAIHLASTGQIDVPGWVPAITRFENVLTSASGARATARHVAALGPVDVLVNNVPALTNLWNAEQQSVVVPPGTYNVGVAPTGTTDAVADGEVTVVAGIVYIAYLIGGPENTFEVLVHQIPMQ